MSDKKKRFKRRLAEREIRRREFRVIWEQGCEACMVIQDDQHGFGPRHGPSPHCESGKKPHCTCDICF